VRVLITNDDGVEAPGLHALAHSIHAAGHDVLVVAPSGERSGSGAAIGRLHRAGPLACTEVEWADLPDVPVYAIDAPPAATVYAGLLGAFGARPDAVASGINPGANTGHLVLHSGTVGAALTAAAVGVPAIAVSIAWGEQHLWTTAAAFAPAALEWVIADRTHVRVCNLNAPNVPLDEVKGVRETVLAPFDENWKTDARPGEIVLEYVGREHDPAPGSDLAAVHDGYVSVTALAGIVHHAGSSGDDGAAASIAAATDSRLDQT
jgi:5'-nucleotidase